MVPPVKLVPPVRLNRCHPSNELNWGHPPDESEKRSSDRIGATRQSTRQLTSGERQDGATRATEQVPPEPVPPGTGATRQSKPVSPSRTNWCHPRVQRRQCGPALGLVFGRQTAAVGAGLDSLLAYSAAEYSDWLILLIPA